MSTMEENQEDGSKRIVMPVPGGGSQRVKDLPRLRNEKSLPSKSLNLEGGSVYKNLPMKQGLF